MGRVYPRVGGATVRARRLITGAEGLSPRGRGNLQPHAGLYAHRGSIPAWAGQPFLGSLLCKWNWVYPRVGGATIWDARQSEQGIGLSPRGRGNPRLPLLCWPGSRVYPPRGRGNPRLTILRDHGPGLSPRGRGNLGLG